MTKASKNKFIIPLIGFLAGVSNGLMGAGGGIILVLGINYALGECVSDKKDIFANALCVMLPVSAVSCICYAIRGSLKINGLALYAVPAVLGGIAGGLILGKIKTERLKKLFAALVIYSGIILVIR